MGSVKKVTQLDLGTPAQSVVLNPITNMVYFSCPDAKGFAVLSGQTNQISMIPTGSNARPGVMAINRQTNTVYAADEGNQYLTALDATARTLVNTPTERTHYLSIAVNEVTNKVYASDYYRHRVTVFDTKANVLGHVQGFDNPETLAINQKTNKIYVADRGGSRVRTIDGRNVAPSFTSTLPPNSGSVGARYHHEMTASGSLTPQFKVASGALPPGLTLVSQNPNGLLSGVPSIPGTFSFRISASNGYGPDALTPTITITIKPADIRHDFTGDKRPDVLARTNSGDLWLYPGNGSGGWQSPSKVGQGWNVMTALVSPGDFTGDGKADVLARDTSGVLWLYPGNGKGGWQARLQVGQGWNAMTAITGIGDLDLDGNADVAARDSSGQLWQYRGNGRGGWLTQELVGRDLNGMNFISGIGDIAKDGTEDLVTRDANGALWSFRGYPRTSFGWGDQIGWGWNAMTAIATPGDFNGDGNVDLLARDSAGTLWLYPGNGKQGWLPRVQVGSGWNVMNTII